VVLVVVNTIRTDHRTTDLFETIRIISARRASRQERRRYEEQAG
jgi:uncharacterized DUF497 family protein